MYTSEQRLHRTYVFPFSDDIVTVIGPEFRPSVATAAVLVGRDEYCGISCDDWWGTFGDPPLSALVAVVVDDAAESYLLALPRGGGGGGTLGTPRRGPQVFAASVVVTALTFPRAPSPFVVLSVRRRKRTIIINYKRLYLRVYTLL